MAPVEVGKKLAGIRQKLPQQGHLVGLCYLFEVLTLQLCQRQPNGPALGEPKGPEVVAT